MWPLEILLFLVAKLWPTFTPLMDCGPSGSSVCGISQARILVWVTIPFSRGSSRPRDQTRVSCRQIPSHLSHDTANSLVKIQRKDLVVMYQKLETENRVMGLSLKAGMHCNVSHFPIGLVITS